MTNLTDFLHKLVDHVGASSLHPDIDALTVDENKNADESGTEDTTNVAE